jgi:hypothetical protein
MILTIIKISAISFLVIYIVHIVFNHFQSFSVEESNNDNSALRNSKRMYEEMAETIKLSDGSTTSPIKKEEVSCVKDLGVSKETIPKKSEMNNDIMNSTPVIDLPVYDTPIVEKRNMESELQSYMETIVNI